MDTRDLDRLVTKTELNPFVKIALRRLRKNIEAGNVTGYSMTKKSWSVKVADPKGLECTWTFTMKDDNGSKN
jgi:hypothetical protein